MTLRALIEQRYREIAAGPMRDLPVCNPRLQVAVVGLRASETERAGRPLGVLITPWCMNLLLLPAGTDRWDKMDSGRERLERFPAGVYRFVHGWDERIGAYCSCSLFSPMFEFADQAAALATAEAVLTALFEPDANGEFEPAANKMEQGIAPAPAAPTSTERLSRRGFLTGGWRRTGAGEPS